VADVSSANGGQIAGADMVYAKSEEWVELTTPRNNRGFVPKDKSFYRGYYGNAPDPCGNQPHPL
jgi:hypothetical protein